MVGNTKAADSADGFADRADDEIDIVDHALIFGYAASVFADKAHAMGLINQNHGAVFLADPDHFLQWRDIAKHRVDAFEHDQLASFGRQTFQTFFQHFDIFMAECDNLGIAQSATIIDGRMAVDVEYDIIAFARQR